jgi:hypothetical protein
MVNASHVACLSQANVGPKLEPSQLPQHAALEPRLRRINNSGRLPHDEYSGDLGMANVQFVGHSFLLLPRV